MFIKELNLKSFGKFLHKQVSFKNGLNIIYGNNEAGKSTIHNFVEIMLYGFRDKNNDENNLYKRFRPWFYDQYNGSMTVDSEDKEYIIRRDFLSKEKEFSKMPYATAIEEKVNDCQEDIEPGEYLFGIDKNTFENTLSIKQLSNSTNEELAYEVKKKIQNLSQSKDETISIENIIKKLENIKNEVGDINNPNSLYSQYNARVQELNQIKDKTIEAKQYTLHLAMEKKKKINKIFDIDQEIANIDKELENYRISLLANKKEKVEKVYDEINGIKSELLQYGEGNNIGIDDYEEALKLITILNQMKQEKAEIEEKMLELNTEMVKLESDPACSMSADGFVVKINLDYKAYLESKDKIDKLQEKVNQGIEHLKSFDTEKIAEFTEIYETTNNNEKQINRINNMINDTSKDLVKKLIKSSNIKRVFSIIFAILFLLTAGSSAFLGYYYAMNELYFGVAVAIISIILFVNIQKLSTKITGLKKEITDIDTKQNEMNEKLKSCTAENDKIFAEKECKNIDELRKKAEYYISLKAVVEEKIKVLEYDKEALKSSQKSKKILEDDILNKLKNFDLTELTDESIKQMNEIVLEKDKIVQELNKKAILLDQLEQNYRKIEKELDYEEKRFNIILSSNNIKNIDEFKAIVNNNYKITQLKDRIQGLERVADNILEDYTYEQICGLTKEFLENPENQNTQNIIKENKLNEIQAKEEQKNSIRKEIEKIDNELDSIEDMSKKLVEIEEEIDFYQEKIEQNQEKIEVADIAIENIMLISDYIKGNFMPLLKNAISENFSYVTGGKYKEVNIDEDMNISVVDEANGEIIDINSLSGGTLDQLYISLRLGLSNLISDNKAIPLILDDSFIQYDEMRLRKSLEILNNESHRRQVILFTCQKREMEIIKQLQFEHNLIKIS